MYRSAAAAALSDDALWLRLRANDKNALGLLAEQHYRALFHYGTKLTSNHALIQDCIQDLFLIIWEKRQTAPVPQSVRAYLFVALRNNILRQVKQDNQCETIGESDVVTDWMADPESLYVQAEHEQTVQTNLQQAMERLPKRQREAIYLKYYENLSYQEIATVMGLNRQVVANYLQNALHNLRDHWHDVPHVLFLLMFLF